MKHTAWIFLLFITSIVAAQNVGIGNSSPSEKLDVTGNINVTGTIKANGVDGNANQVLMKNSSGTLQWGDMCGLKNFQSFYTNGNFTVPAGVTSITVELWGGGGGGNANAGGGGGGYLKAQIIVAPGDVCTIVVGTGGSGAANATASPGSASSIAAPSTFFTATGGSPASYTAPSRYNPGIGGLYTASSPLNNYIGMTGTAGGITKRNYAQVNSTNFYEMIEGGKGGYSFGNEMGAGNAPYIVYNLTTSTQVQLSFGILDARGTGGGGGGGLTYAGGATLAGGTGDRGLVMIYY